MGDVVHFRGQSSPPPGGEPPNQIHCWQCFWCDSISFIVHIDGFLQCTGCGFLNQVTITLGPGTVADPDA